MKGDKNAYYSFKLVNENPIPIDGSLKISLPSSVSYNSRNLNFTCLSGCVTEKANLTLDEEGKELRVEGLFEEYVKKFEEVSFSLGPFVNPNNYGNNFFKI
mmetsp:Transcript_18122/g.13173  ORF Transcript_18122/g.13173 Transcript_18122/m.13173 type:complete len:101 (-) Transcript_18122:470-772(-)|eukprot:CAMPEP_0202963478 /NCGR_PEP_ID=MMETSP1396-20130829/7472_1 /ASSEMBLY_ACC=CAM_ASM_000872 /TAXON_ID= /ORGANISM="Pseudokeronopsis sp., Strain Brazil" /LENGTH=100 /DNA_ID=CAMNT_0049684725 /DNA_START=896 /DNA_END=1198 /DNA_ORIENTATION=+